LDQDTSLSARAHRRLVVGTTIFSATPAIAFLAGTGKPDLRHIPTRANGQPGIGWYLWHPPSGRYRPASLEVLALERDRVSEITAFTGRMCAATQTGSLPDLFPRFGLPTELPREGS
jgi:hypothetical protein